MIRDVLGDRATDQLLDVLEPLALTFRRLGWNELKPWTEFAATFKPPQLNAAHLEQRVTTNFLYYRTNYLHICGGVLALRLLSAPSIIFAALAVFGVWTYLLQVYTRPLVLGDIVLDERGKQWLCVGLSFLILLGSGAIERLLWTAFACAVLCGGHMVLRPRNVSAKANRVYEEAKASNVGGFFFSEPYRAEAKSYDTKAEDLEGSPPTNDFDSKYADGDALLRRRYPATSGVGNSKYST